MDPNTILQFRRKLKALRDITGNGTSMITLLLPPGYQISRANHMLTDEYGKASNIKSRVNRLSVESAIRTTQYKLKIYNKLPPNGLALFCGNGLVDGKEKILNIDIIPIKPLISSIYLCDDSFHTEALERMLTDDNIYGFIIVDGNGALYATLSGVNKHILESFTVDLPHKHGRGGQSALRFDRLRLEAHHNYIRKVAEHAVKNFIANDMVNTKGIIFAGSAQFKDKIIGSNLFDPRLKKNIIGVLDISYGGDAGFEQAIEQSAPLLRDVRYLDEKKILLEFFNEIEKDGNYIYGLKQTLDALKAGAINKLIIHDESELVYPDLVSDEHIMLLDWVLENAHKYGTKLFTISDNIGAGSQFINGFGGFGGVLRYKITIEQDNEIEDVDFEGFI